MKKRMIGCGVRGVRRRLLVYDKALPMREPSACLFTFATAVCKKGKEESPRAAAFTAEFRARARNSSAFAAGGVVGFASAGDWIFFELAEGGCEPKQDSQGLEHRQGLSIFELALSDGTKTIADENLLSCKGADGVTQPDGRGRWAGALHFEWRRGELRCNNMDRTAEIFRQTKETKVKLSLNLDGTGKTASETGVGFFDHMMELLGRHSLIDLSVHAEGDLQVDAHHTVEDVGIVLGQALEKALGDKRGICRYGWAIVPMDETLAQVAIDLSGRPAFVYNAKYSGGTVGSFPVELVEEFFKAVAINGKLNLHINVAYGGNNHHIAEAIFKATAKTLRQAVSLDPRNPEVPSTKGSLG